VLRVWLRWPGVARCRAASSAASTRRPYGWPGMSGPTVRAGRLMAGGSGSSRARKTAGASGRGAWSRPRSQSSHHWRRAGWAARARSRRRASPRGPGRGWRLPSPVEVNQWCQPPPPWPPPDRGAAGPPPCKLAEGGQAGGAVEEAWRRQSPQPPGPVKVHAGRRARSETAGSPGGSARGGA
jgi:hypothetical protein